MWRISAMAKLQSSGLQSLWGYVEYFRHFTRREKCITADLVGAAKILKHIYKRR